MKLPIFNILNDEDLIKIVQSSLLTDQQLEQIQTTLKLLFELEMSDNREMIMIDDESYWPYKPYLILDPEIHSELYSYIMLSQIGVGPLYSDEFPGWDFENRKDVIILK